MKNDAGPDVLANGTAATIAARLGTFEIAPVSLQRKPARHAGPDERPTPLTVSKPQEVLHLLLFIWESCEGNNAAVGERDSLRFFFRRAGGVHLLLMLLNAHYSKREAGRRPGWQFCVLHDRIRISKRALRMLIQDAQAEGYLGQLPGIRDRRSRTYFLAPAVVEAWERLVDDLGSSLADVLTFCGPNELANADYRTWDPEKPAALQIQETRPYKLPHRS